MIICEHQHIVFKTLSDGSVNTGSNKVSNGSFDEDLAYWLGLNTVQDSGVAKYVKDEESVCNIGRLEQTIALQAGYYTLRFKYRATSAFDITMEAEDDDDSSILFTNTITAQADGLWHTVTYSFTLSEAHTILLRLQNTSTGGEEEDECGATGLAEDGFFWDDVSIYEQTWPRECAPCDVFIQDKNKDLEFQLRGEVTDLDIIENADFETNPYDAIDLVDLGEEDGFAFDIETVPDNGQYFEIYACGKIFRFTRSSGLVPVVYSVVQTGNFYDITVKGISVSYFNENLIVAINEVVDVACGSTSTYQPDPLFHFAVFFSTPPVYINDPFGLLTNIQDVTPSEVTGKGFYYDPDAKKMCYDYTGFPVQFGMAPIALTSGVRYRFRFRYSSSYNDFTGSVTIYNGIGATQTVNYTVEVTDDGYIDIYFTANTTADHILTINLTDPVAGLHYSGFCFDDLSISTVDALASISYRDCEGNAGSLGYLSTTVDDLTFVQAPSSGLPANTPYTLTVTSSTGQTFESYPIKLIDALQPDGCKDYLKLNWTDDCQFGCLDYAVFPFTNELYLSAYVVAQQPAKRQSESIGFRRHYVHSAERWELRINNYSKVMHLLLARALEHGTIRINDQDYYADDDTAYTMSEVGHGYFTARISLIKSGTEIRKSGCCC